MKLDELLAEYGSSLRVSESQRRHWHLPLFDVTHRQLALPASRLDQNRLDDLVEELETISIEYIHQKGRRWVARAGLDLAARRTV